MTALNQIAPTLGSNANSYEWMWDICTNPAESPRKYMNVPDITGLAPLAPPKNQDDATYANKGQDSQSKIGETFSLQVTVKAVLDANGELQPYLIALIKAADATGSDNIIGHRYYHATSEILAYEGTAGVEWVRQNTGNADLEFFSFTLTGKGDRKRIPNPARETAPKPLTK